MARRPGEVVQITLIECEVAVREMVEALRLARSSRPERCAAVGQDFAKGAVFGAVIALAGVVVGWRLGRRTG